MSDAVHCLVVGLPQDLLAAGVTGGEGARSIAYADLPRHLPAGPTLTLVIAPLFCPDFDALEMIETLGRAGYRGRVRIVAPKLPNRQVVLRELRAHATRQGITLDLVESA